MCGYGFPGAWRVWLSDYKVHRLYRNAKILKIYEGTTEIEKNIISKDLIKKIARRTLSK